MKYIYLAGPLTSKSFLETDVWRQEVKSKLPTHIRTLSPLRGLEHLRNEEDLKHTYGAHPLSTAKGLTMKDYNDVDRSDAVLVNFLGATKASIGTVMEISRSAAKGIPVVCVMEDDNVHQHPMLNQGCGVIVKSLQEGIDAIVAIVSDDKEMEDYLKKQEFKKQLDRYNEPLRNYWKKHIDKVTSETLDVKKYRIGFDPYKKDGYSSNISIIKQTGTDDQSKHIYEY
jgi:nucleoside 2-deoxyribosyltransferase